jgi:sugar O-acyltransferase (sialic acid O-acetyltransferase NeuD family)
MQKTRIGIYGAGGFAREVAWLVSNLSEFYEVVCFISDDAQDSTELHGLPVYSFEQFTHLFQRTLVSIAIGNPATREKIAARCASAGFQFATLQDPTVYRSAQVEIGAGSIICAHSILTVDIRLGRQVHINLDCTVGHDVVMDDFVTLAPGVHVSGNVHIGRGAYIGTGANIINGTSDKPLVIGEGAVIGAGACITKNCEPRCLYAGVPAELKKRY